MQLELHQLAMAAAYLGAGMADVEATFEVRCTGLPPGHGYLVTAGQESALAAILAFRLGDDLLRRLRTMPQLAAVGADVLDALGRLQFEGDVWGVPEGAVVFAGEPILRVTGAVATAQLLEAHLLSAIAMESGVATRAARIVSAAGSLPVLDLGLSSLHGPASSVAAARAAILGGCIATSNVEAATLTGVPCVGAASHAHTLAHYSEEVAFVGYCRVLGQEQVLAVDTYDAARGAARAVAAGRIRGVRIEGGDDLVARAASVRAALDDAGRPDATVLATGRLDEHRIAKLVEAGSVISSLGIQSCGGWDEVSLTYELVSFTREAGRAHPCIRFAEGEATPPGPRQVWRRFDEEGVACGDTVGLADEEPPPHGSPLMVPMIRAGSRVHVPPEVSEMQHGVQAALEDLPPGVRALSSPDRYPVAPSAAIESLRLRLAAQRRSEQ